MARETPLCDSSPYLLQGTKARKEGTPFLTSELLVVFFLIISAVNSDVMRFNLHIPLPTLDLSVILRPKKSYLDLKSGCTSALNFNFA